jgi:hypothetical protein
VEQNVNIQARNKNEFHNYFKLFSLLILWAKAASVEMVCPGG